MLYRDEGNNLYRIGNVSTDSSYAVLAQLVEHLPEEQGVPGSIPGDGTSQGCITQLVE